MKTITLPEPQINTILERLHGGAYMPEIAAELEVVPSTLRKILIRQAADRYAAFANRPPPPKELKYRKSAGRPTPETSIDPEAVAIFTGYMPTTTGSRLRWIL
jgi:hypothetical protein